MAGHARFGRRKTRESGVFHAGVTVTAVDAVVFYMVLMTKRNWLLRRLANRGNPVAAIHYVTDRER